jgi:putative ABC transport system permease protein
MILRGDNMLKRKMFRDIKQNISQFITIFLMVLIGVMVYIGIEAYMDGMQTTSDNFYKNYNLQDLNVLGTSFTNEDLSAIKYMDNVNNAELKLVFNAINGDDKNKNFLVSFIESNTISKFYVVSGDSFDANKKGVWLDNFYAEENNLKIGDTIKFKYDTFTLEEKILGLINVPDHLYDVKDESELIPNRSNYGFVYLSVNEFPKNYIKKQVMKKMNISDESSFDKMIPSFNYRDYIPYNYIMVDVDKKINVNSVKNNIEDNISNALSAIKIEDTSSYTMYQGEIDEGKAYVGIFSGLFLFIAMLSVITTMTRVVKQQRLQIGTLKALGFSKIKITAHYVGYGFWVALLGAICGIAAGKYFIGTVFMNLEMEYFEIPNGTPVIDKFNYVIVVLVVLCVSLITYFACRKELIKSPSESLRNELPKVKDGSLNITSKGIFRKMSFSSVWNFRDIIRNKFRTLTGIIGIAGCCTLIVCAFGMLNSMNYFIKLQFQDLYNFDYKLSLHDNLDDEEIAFLTDKYGNFTSQTLGIEIKYSDGNRESNNAFVTDAGNYIRFQDDSQNFITIDKNNGVYVTYKLAQLKGYKIGDTISWHIYGNKKYYQSKILGFNKDPQNQNITMTKDYLESLGIKYTPDSIYTNQNLKKIKEIKNVEIIQDIEELKESIQEMLSMMTTMIIFIIIFAVLLGGVIIYNMGILSYNEKQYQFATLKVLGFENKQIKKIFVKQNNWIAVFSIIIGLPSGYYLTDWLFTECLDDNYDFGVHINMSTYIIAAIGTFIISYIVSSLLSKKIKKIDMVSSLKGNE